jgi:urease subunit alpha
MTRMSRETYASVYGPTTGDRVRLGDTNLFAEVEWDDNTYGSELLVGYGKTIRDGMLASGRAGNASKLDYIITGVVVMDPILGIFKSNIGIKDGRIVGVGRAGNPDVVDDVELVVGSNTGIVAGEGLIATPGGVDTHVHLTSTSLLPAALSGGLTTFAAMGSGSTWDVGVNPGINLHRMFEAFEQVPINVAFLGRGSSAHPGPLWENVEAGCAGLKIHEDFGAFPSIVDNALNVADESGVQVAMHTDSINESAQLAETLEAIGGRSVHAYHVEGAGGGHTPDLLEIASEPAVIPSSTNPTIPYTVNTAAEHEDMIAVVHMLRPELPGDMASARARVRESTVAAEDWLHDMGAISIMSSDSLGMGRIGEVITRTWQLAHRMKELAGPERPNDNRRILRYLAKYTINPAIAHGLAAHVGSLEPGKLADIILWDPAYFGVKPEMVMKGGFVVWGPEGDGNAATPIAQPLRYRPSYGALGNAPASLSVNFVSQASLDAGLAGRLRSARRCVAVGPIRDIGKGDMVHNSACPEIRVDPGSLDVTIDGTAVRPEPAGSLPLTHRYFIG